MTNIDWIKETPKHIKWIYCTECRHLYERDTVHDCRPPGLSEEQIRIGHKIAERHGLLVPPTGIEPARLRLKGDSQTTRDTEA